MVTIKEELKDWIEMKRIRASKFDSSVWIPLYSMDIQKEGKSYNDGYSEDIFSLKSVLIPKDDFENAKYLNWSNLANYYDATFNFDSNGNYIPCDILDKDYYKADGIFPVLPQRIGHNLIPVLHLHQDIVIALKLYREGDKWVCPEEDYTEVVRLFRDNEGFPIKIEIKNEYLKDYLCARNMGLFLTCYYSHIVYLEKKPDFNWKSDYETVTFDAGTWTGRVYETSRNGGLMGDALVIHVSRTDVDKNDDVPVMGNPSDGNLKSESKVVSFKDNAKIFRAEGEVRKNEIIPPGSFSTRIRQDKPQYYPFFKIDAAGTEKTSEQLSDEGRWLWFSPEVVNTILSKRDGDLKWGTKDTGSLSCSCGYDVHFGINEIGLITVYAEDIKRLPVWQQKIWAGFNVAPNGKVSKELLMSQVDAEPADTQAPEDFLTIEYNRLNELFEKSFGVLLFRRQKELNDLMPKIHRFRSLSEENFYNLAKDLARITADAIDAKGIKELLADKSKKELGSLKTLQDFLIQKLGVETESAKKIMSPLFAIYDMRQVDAHLGDASKDNPYISLGVSRDLPPLFRATAMLEKFVTTLCVIQKIINAYLKNKR